MNSPSLAPGTVLGKYSIVRLIGAGGMGAVYEALHLDLRKRVALKTLLPSLAAMPEARARFLREGEAASRIDHPHVVNVTDVGTGGETPFLVMEFLEGEDLAQRLERGGPMPLDATIELLLPIMDALASGHDEGVIHRDLKPHNIFLARARDGRIVPKLLDFGVSKILDGRGSSALTGSLHMLGTAQYMAPEQIEGAKNVDARTDQYAMGLVLFECVAGVPARQGETPLGMLRGVALGQLPPLRAMKPDLDPAFEAVLLRTLSLEPAGRLPTMRDLMSALLAFARPHTRVHWSEALMGRSATMSAVTPPMAKTMILSDSGGQRAPSGPPIAPVASTTTFRNTAGEMLAEETWRPRARVRWPLVVGGLGLVGLLAAGAFVVLPALDGSSRRARRAERAKATVLEKEAESALGSPQSSVLSPQESARPAAPRARRKLEIRATPSEATITVDDVPLGRSPALFEPTPGAHQLVVAAPGHQTVTVEFSDESPPPALIELVRLEPPKQPDAPRPRHKERFKRVADSPAPETDVPARRGANNSLIIE